MARNYSPEEIARRSENAKALNREGRFGGAQPGSGRPPTKRRAAQKVAEAAEKHSDEIIAAFREAVQPGNPASVRVQAAREWITVERQERELSLKEEKSFEDMSAPELIAAIMAKFGRLEAGGQDFDFNEEEIEEVEVLQIEDGGEDFNGYFGSA